MFASDPFETETPDAMQSAEVAGYAAFLRTEAEAGNLRKSDSTRLRLLAAVAAHLTNGGKDTELRVTDIADAASVAHGTFYRYFPDRDAAVEAVVAGFVSFIHDGLRGERRGATGTLGRARAATLAYVRLFRSNAGLMRLLLAIDVASPARERFHALNREWNHRVAAAIALRRASGSKVTPAMIATVLPEAYALGGMVDEFLAQIYLRRDPALLSMTGDEEAVADLLTRIWFRAAYGDFQGDV